MKKRISFLFLVLATLFTGCSKDELSNEPVAFKEGQKVTITASMDDGATRATTSYDGTNITTEWELNDVALVTVGGKSGNFTVKSIDGSGNATLEGTMPASGTTFTVQYPASAPDISSQTYSTSEALPKNKMLYKSAECSLDGTASLVAQNSVLILNLYGTDTTVGKIEVKKGAETYTLSCGTGKKIGATSAEATPFYIVVPSGSYVFDAKIYNNASSPSELASFTPSSAQPFAVGQYINMPAKEVNGAPKGIYFEALENGMQVALCKIVDTGGSVRERSYDDGNSRGSSRKYAAAPIYLSYSTDGATWTDVVVDEYFPSTPLNAGQKVYVRAKDGKTNSTFNFTEGDYEGWYNFQVYQKFNLGGDIMYLLNGETPPTSITTEKCFRHMFTGSYVVDASKLKLPANVTKLCYSYMLNDCDYLTSVPSLPATILAEECYSHMFESCESLTTIPSGLLPATKLAAMCYYDMFRFCSNLVSVPSDLLPATELAELCYYEMFKSCGVLTSVPSLPATDLTGSDDCYCCMFQGCSSLETVPTAYLPATKLSSSCYDSMFDGCSSLKVAPELNAEKLIYGCYQNMFNNCSNIKTITMLATDIPEYTLDYWIYDDAMSSSTDRILYVHPTMVLNSEIHDYKYSFNVVAKPSLGFGTVGGTATGW